MSVITAGVAALVVVLATVVQRLTGMGFGIVAVPLLALAAPEVGVFAVLVLTVIVMAAVTWAERDALDGRALGVAALASLPGVALGTILAARLPATATHLMIGVVVIAASAASLLGWRVVQRPATLIAGAVAAGVLTPVAALPGPPMAIVYRPADVRRMRATLSAFFAVGSAVSAATVLFVGETDVADELMWSAVLVPAIVIGVLVAIPLVSRLRPDAVRSGTLVISALSGLALAAASVADLIG